jgi:hypothetical protein
VVPRPAARSEVVHAGRRRLNRSGVSGLIGGTALQDNGESTDRCCSPRPLTAAALEAIDGMARLAAQLSTAVGRFRC